MIPAVADASFGCGGADHVWMALLAAMILFSILEPFSSSRVRETLFLGWRRTEIDLYRNAISDSAEVQLVDDLPNMGIGQMPRFVPRGRVRALTCKVKRSDGRSRRHIFQPRSSTFRPMTLGR